MRTTIRALRTRANLTQRELAELLSVDQSAISQWETGRTLPDREKLPKLAQVLGVGIQDLFARETLPAIDVAAPAMPNDAPNARFASREASVDDSPSPLQARALPATVPLAALARPRSNGPQADELVGRTVEVPAGILEKHPRAQAVIVTDDCMSRVAPKGSIAVFDPDLAPTNGHVAIVEDEEHGTIMRRWHQGNNTLMLTADSFQPHDDIVLQGEWQCRPVGTVVYVSVPPELF
jgi:repressor LexA